MGRLVDGKWSVAGLGTGTGRDERPESRIRSRATRDGARRRSAWHGLFASWTFARGSTSTVEG